MAPFFAAIGTAFSTAGAATAATAATATAASVGTGLTVGGAGLGLTAASTGLGFVAPVGATIGAGTAATVGAASLFTAANLQMLSSGVSALSQVYQGQQQRDAYRLQSQQAALKGRQDALRYNRRAVDTMKANMSLEASLRARAAAGGVDPFSGSSLSLAQANDIAAYEEVRIDQENAQMSLYGGLAQSQSLQVAAATANTYGMLRGAIDATAGGARFLDVRNPGIS